MSFQDAIRTCLQKYVVFSGRARRSEYWWWVLFIVLASLAFGLIDSVLFNAGDGGTGGPIGLVFSLATLLPSIAVGVRRLHDIDRTGWWMLIGFVPIIGFFVLLYFFVQKGTAGPNRFGADPVEGDASASLAPGTE
jgi:uncharacterized membrane protein YhaH (DUF805 family)